MFEDFIHVRQQFDPDSPRAEGPCMCGTCVEYRASCGTETRTDAVSDPEWDHNLVPGTLYVVKYYYRKYRFGKKYLWANSVDDCLRWVNANVKGKVDDFEVKRVVKGKNIGVA